MNISNQNALLSLLSQEDFSHLKNKIHDKIVNEPIQPIVCDSNLPIEEQQEDDDKQEEYEGKSHDECIR